MASTFHMAFPVRDIEQTRNFYVNILGCSVTKSTDSWLNLNFFGHQLSIHHHPRMIADPKTIVVEGQKVPLQHFGVILKKKEWELLADKLMAAKVRFLIEPRTRYKEQMCEQEIMFLKDPSGNGIEFKCFTDPRKAFNK